MPSSLTRGTIRRPSKRSSPQRITVLHSPVRPVPHPVCGSGFCCSADTLKGRSGHCGSSTGRTRIFMKNCQDCRRRIPCHAGRPFKEKWEDIFPIPPYVVCNIGGGQPETLLDYISTLQEELVRQVFSTQIMILKATGNWSVCRPAMSLRPTLTLPPWRGTKDLPPKLASGKASGLLPSGLPSIINNVLCFCNTSVYILTLIFG